MANLRDKGYPQSRTEKVNRSDKRNALMSNETPVMTYKGSMYMGENAVPSDSEVAFNRLVNAYNNKAFGIPNAPMLSRGSADYIDDATDSRAVDNSLALRDHSGNRLGYAGKTVVDAGGTNYHAGIDNLYFLGGGTFDKEFNTPVGTFGVGYDGDGTAYGSYQSPYYLQALVNLMNRGSL